MVHFLVCYLINFNKHSDGDIGNSSKYYAQAIFDHFNFDSITVAPYMGIDSIEPFSLSFFKYLHELFKLHFSIQYLVTGSHILELHSLLLSHFITLLLIIFVPAGINSGEGMGVISSQQ